MLGMHGTVFANFAVDEADLLLAFGVRFDDRVTGKLETFASKARVVHIDIDPAEICKNKEAHVMVCSDTRPALKGEHPWSLHELWCIPHDQRVVELAQWKRRTRHFQAGNTPLVSGTPGLKICCQHQCSL